MQYPAACNAILPSLSGLCSQARLAASQFKECQGCVAVKCRTCSCEAQLASLSYANMNSANTQGTGRTNKIPGIDNQSQEKKKPQLPPGSRSRMSASGSFPMNKLFKPQASCLGAVNISKCDGSRQFGTAALGWPREWLAHRDTPTNPGTQCKRPTNETGAQGSIRGWPWMRPCCV